MCARAYGIHSVPMIFHFDKALVRSPARSVVHGLTHQSGPRPTFEAVAREHAEYIAALGECGLQVQILAPLDDYPDSIFVEDPALVFGSAAILLRPGAPSRLGEAAQMEQSLKQRFASVLSLPEGYADGGDMLLTPSGMFIGLSKRTDQSGANALAALLRQLDIPSRIVATPPGTLHLKSDCALVAED